MAINAERASREAQRTFVAIGHITNDSQPTDHLGGGVSYSGMVAERSGLKTSILTKCRENDPYVNYLRERGIDVYVAPSKLDTITTFANIYDKEGNRKQKVSTIQETITAEDLNELSPGLLNGAVALVAPVIDEVDMSVFPALKEQGATVAVTPQGYFREAASDGTVLQKRWDGFTKYLPYTSAVVFSNEDLTNGGKVDRGLQREIVEASPLAVMTLGGEGVIIYEQGKDPVEVPAFPLYPTEIVDLTGAGDTFTARLLIGAEDKPRATAAAEAHVYTAVKLMGRNGLGLDSIPTEGQVAAFARTHQDRVEEYFAKNGQDNPYRA